MFLLMRTWCQKQMFVQYLIDNYMEFSVKISHLSKEWIQNVSLICSLLNQILIHCVTICGGYSPNENNQLGFNMMTSSNGNFFRVIGPLWGESIGDRWFPWQWPVTWSFDVFFNLRLNKRLCKQSWRRWFEMPSCSLWRHVNENSVLHRCQVVEWQFGTVRIHIGWRFLYNQIISAKNRWHDHKDYRFSALEMTISKRLNR